MDWNFGEYADFVYTARVDRRDSSQRMRSPKALREGLRKKKPPVSTGGIHRRHNRRFAW
jgi:hypothetical protein